MAELTPTTNFTELLPANMAGVRLTTGSASDTYECPYFAEVGAVIGNNESDNDGVSIAVSGTAITIVPNTSGDVITLIICGRG